MLILDNADDLDMVKAFMPTAEKGHIILTTRAQAIGTIAQRIEIEKMSMEEGTIFLLRRIKRCKSNAALETVTATVREQAQAVVEAVDGLPLALDQAGAYIEETGCSLSDYLKFYKTRRNRLLRTRGRDASGHPEPVATTWSLSFERVERANPAAAELLRLLAFLHPDAIPESMIMGGASELGPTLQPMAEDELDLNDAIGELHKYSLIKRDPEGKILNIHRLVQVVMKDGMSKDMLREWAGRTVHMVNYAFPEVEFATWPICQVYLPHVQVYKGLIEQCGLTFPETTLLLSRAGYYLQKRAQYIEAESFYNLTLTIREKVLSTYHADVGATLYSLAQLYQDQAKYERAELFYQRNLAIREHSLESDHPDMAQSLNGLASLYDEQSKYELAEPLFQRVLTIYEQKLGVKHFRVAETLNNLGLLYRHQGKYEHAEVFYQRCLTVCEQVLEPNLMPSRIL